MVANLFGYVDIGGEIRIISICGKCIGVARLAYQMGKFRISGVPITEGRKLVGIITNRDLKFEEDFTKKIKESMTSEGLITAKEGITLEEAKKILAKAEKRNYPLLMMILT